VFGEFGDFFHKLKMENLVKLIEATKNLPADKQEAAAKEFLRNILKDLSRTSENYETAFANHIQLWTMYLLDAINLS